MKHSCPIILLRFSAMAFVVLLLQCLCGCSAERFLQEDEVILQKVKLTSDNKHVKAGDYRLHVRQEANSRWFNLVKVPLGIYCLSGTDTTKRINRFVQRIGEAPVVYDEQMAHYSRRSMESALQGRGYLHATVSLDTTGGKGRRCKVHYHMSPGERYYVNEINFSFDSEQMQREVLADTARSLLYKGMPLDASLLAEERTRIIRTLQNKGYYDLHKDFISYRADTLFGDRGVRLTLNMLCPPEIDARKAYSRHRLRHVNVYEDVTPSDSADTCSYRGLHYGFDERLHIHKRVYSDHVHVRPDSLYSSEAVQRTYAGLNSLPAISYSGVRFSEVPADTTGMHHSALDCDILVHRAKPHSISTELEGTNTSGDLGAAVSITYSNRNLFRHAESLSLKLRGAYEAITGLEGYNDANYIEYGAEANLRFPSLMFPFIKEDTRKHLLASTDFTLMFNSQDRPEFHRRVLTAAWSYNWQHRLLSNIRHRVDLLSLNYVYMPWISETFRNNYLEGDDPRYAVLRYSYENLFIMKTGYGVTLRSRGITSAQALQKSNGYQMRFNVELAGNLLYGLSKLFSAEKNAEGQYSIFDIAYSQYAKFDFDFSKNFIIDSRNSLAVHAAFGIAIPYGNSDIVPYEKRYFAGGANSVRGWSVRELGPGSYKGEDGQVDFINQTGNLKLDLSVEYRTHLFWKLQGAAFIDAGNIWNTRNYLAQPGSQFKFNEFYRQIAVSYGLGIRLNFDYFILRFDGGMKAINPTEPHTNRLHYPIICPKFSRDFTFHFAVGLPF